MAAESRNHVCIGFVLGLLPAPRSEARPANSVCTFRSHLLAYDHGAPAAVLSQQHPVCLSLSSSKLPIISEAAWVCGEAQYSVIVSSSGGKRSVRRPQHLINRHNRCLSDRTATLSMAQPKHPEMPLQGPYYPSSSEITFSEDHSFILGDEFVTRCTIAFARGPTTFYTRDAVCCNIMPDYHYS